MAGAIQFFRLLKNALIFLQKSSERSIIAVDHINKKTKNVVKHWLVFESESAMRKYVKSARPCNSHFYEVLLENKPVQEVYDIDLKIDDSNRHLTPETVCEQFFAEYSKTMAARGEQCTPEFRVLDSSDEFKISLHIINLKRAFTSTDSLKKWYEQFDDNNTLIDKCIARKNGAFRMLGSCKLGSKRVLKRAEWHQPSMNAPDSDFSVIRINSASALCDEGRIPNAESNSSLSERVSRRVPAKVKPNQYFEQMSYNMLKYIIDELPQDYCQHSREKWYTGVMICARYEHRELAHELAKKSLNRYNKQATDDMYDQAMSKPITVSFRTLLFDIKKDKNEDEFKSFFLNMKCDYEIQTKLTCATVTIDEARVDLLQYLKIGTILLKSNLMTFKSTSIGDFMLSDEYKNKRIVWITNRVALAKDIINEKFPDQSFRLYNNDSIKEENGCISAEKNPRLVIQLNSIHLIRGGYDLVILDEVESVMDILVNFTEMQYECAHALKELIRYADCVIGCDATLTDSTCEILQKMRANKSSVVINNQYQSMRGRKCVFKFTPDEGPFLEYIKTLLRAGKKLTVPTNSKSMAKKVEKLACEFLDPKRVGVFYQGTNICTVSDWDQYDIIIYSPSISTGVSFNKLWFDQVVAYFVNTSASAETSLQMLFRVRNTKDNVIQIFYRHKYVDIANLALTTEDVEKQTLENADAFKSRLIKMSITTPNNITRNWYYNMYEHCILLKNRSKVEHIPILRGLLSQHGIECSIEYVKKTESSTELKREISDKVEVSELEEAELVMNTELVDEETYDGLCKKSIHSNLNQDERRQIKKRYMHNVLEPKTWSPELVKTFSERDYRALHSYREAMFLMNSEHRANIDECLEQEHKAQVDNLENEYKSCESSENKDYDKYIIKLLHSKPNSLKRKLALGLIRAAGFAGFMDARNLELNYEALREYIIGHESEIKGVWRSRIKKLDSTQALIHSINNKIKDCGFQLVKYSKNRSQNFELKLLSHKILKDHGIDTRPKTYIIDAT